MPRARRITVYIETESEYGAETEYEVSCSATPGSPGRVYGPPEKCYPPEDMSLEVIDVRDGLGSLPPAALQAFLDAHGDEIDALAAEALEDVLADEAAERAEREFDAWRERERDDWITHA